MLLEQLQKNFSLSKAESISFIESAPNRYKFYNVKKRHGGEREIAEPTRTLKTLQLWAMNQYLLDFDIHSSAIAYVKKKNIKDFVYPHTKNKYLLKLDFKDFFNSIKSHDFRLFLENTKFNLDDKEVDLLTKIFFCKNKKNGELYLSIGAPTSPFISNILMVEFDGAISSFCEKNDIVYTRYADDLAFSTNKPNTLHLIINEVDNLCKKVKFPKKLSINREKTVFTSKKHNRTLTGLVISNDGKIGIGREKKRKLRITAHKASLGLLSELELEKFKGMLAFLLSIDPNLSNYLKNKANL
ncbi:reverse transcriptase [Bibersteinia trehalosi Y31]|uniref:RNA-directed DNA polymerase n=1 Tax=Bibersteinia trehalosi Y31 TaxID=1261658 RepID=A0A179CXE9_BIBTR|nr:retron St85 family RNA-directed DNA polymerase [Bibersteinia trehalosi]OAQ14472.1 reverse transcriptase [Bibersteinia trehalosi Y31]